MVARIKNDATVYMHAACMSSNAYALGLPDSRKLSGSCPILRAHGTLLTGRLKTSLGDKPSFVTLSEERLSTRYTETKDARTENENTNLPQGELFPISCGFSQMLSIFHSSRCIEASLQDTQQDALESCCLDKLILLLRYFEFHQFQRQ